MDWGILHALNSGVAVRDWLEDPVTVFAAVAVPLYAAATVGLWLLAPPYGALRWKLASASALTAAAVAMLANQALAHVWERPRPYAAHASLHLLAPASPDPSFPSDHAAAAFAIAFAVLVFSRRAGAVFLGMAALIGLSRLALGMHYPSDVLAGLAVGCLSACVVTVSARRPLTRCVATLSKATDPLLSRAWRWWAEHRPRALFARRS